MQITRELEQRSDIALKQFASGEEIQGLLLAMQSAQALSKLIPNPGIVEQYPATSPAVNLQVILDNIRQRNELNLLDAATVIAFSPDGQRFASSNSKGVIKIHSLAGKLLSQFRAEPVISMNFNSNGRYLIIASLGGSIRIWNIVTQQWTAFVVRHPGTISVSFDPANQSIAATSFNGFIDRWNLKAQHLGQTNLNRTIDVSATTISPNAQYIAVDDRVSRAVQMENLANDQ